MTDQISSASADFKKNKNLEGGYSHKKFGGSVAPFPKASRYLKSATFLTLFLTRSKIRYP